MYIYMVLIFGVHGLEQNGDTQHPLEWIVYE